jgi:RNA polymerase sigma factor (sigma-70 family)
MDNLLLSYLSADNESDRQKRLEALLLVHAAPRVRKILRRRLGLFVTAQGVNEQNNDAEDLYQEAMTKIAQALHDLSASSGQAEIKDFSKYVNRVTVNVCIDALRSKSPERTRLKDALRDLFKRHEELVAWVNQGEILCGFVIWRNMGKTFFSEQQPADVEGRMDSFRAARFPHEDLKRAPITQVVAELFDWIGGPVEIDALVAMMAVLLGLQELRIESLDDESRASREAHFLASAVRSDSDARTKELLTLLWDSVKRLPAAQRDVFCLSFEDLDGQDLFTLLLSNGVLTVTELARDLGRSVSEIILLSEKIPMDTATLAVELKMARSQVWKLRFRAIQKLKVQPFLARK